MHEGSFSLLHFLLMLQFYLTGCEYKQQLEKCVESGDETMGKSRSRAEEVPEFGGVFL